MDNFNHQHIQLAYKAIYNENLCEELENYGIIDYDGINEETLKAKEEREAEIARRRARVKQLATQGRVMTSSRRASAIAKERREANKAEALEKAAQAIINQETGASGRRSERPMGSTPPPEREKAPEATRRLRTGLKRDTLGSAADEVLKQLRKEDYEFILSYLIDEGYTDDLESAEIILENMSEEWLDEVLEEGRMGQLNWKYEQRYGKPEKRDTLRQHVARKKYEDAASRHQQGWDEPNPNTSRPGKLTKGQMMYKAHRSAAAMKGER